MVIASRHASCCLPTLDTAAKVTNSDGRITPAPRFSELLLNVSPTSAAPRPARPSRIAVSAFGRLVSGARISTPSTVLGMCQSPPSVSAAWTMPTLPSDDQDDVEHDQSEQVVGRVVDVSGG